MNDTENRGQSEEKVKYQAELFSNRLAKQYRILRKWARKNRVTCYRLYDRDIPEIPLSADLYTFLPPGTDDKISAASFIREENEAISKNDASSARVLEDEKNRTYLHLYLYERPYEKAEDEEKIWLEAMAQSAAETLGIRRENVIIKTRKKQSGNDEGRQTQYEKIEGERRILGLVQEQGQIFTVNLSDYIDTGLFFDHRPLRNHIRMTCSGKSVLNLFCYTGSFSVYAAEGKARRVESVDMSKTYLEWAEDNMRINGFSDEKRYVFTRQDVNGYLNQKNAEVANKEGTNRFDIIILDPPTFSNSKRTDTVLDINRDWPDLVKKCLSILTPHGILYFSTNSRRLTFSEDQLPKSSSGEILFKAEEITSKTIPEDYRNSRIHRAWKIERKS